MTGGIFLIQNDGKLVEMNEREYDSEKLLQDLLAQYPDVLAGDRGGAASNHRWLLIKREMGIPSEKGGADRWAVDHLFLDQDAIPTLVEVKRRKDTRIRREVVGQMLDYAANAVVYWPVEEMRGQFEKTCVSRGGDCVVELAEFLGTESTVEEFWQKAKTNLQAGKIRMIFVADVIPKELKRIVEFLNEQMDPAEVLAVEIKQFAGEGVKTLVPRVYGQTAEAETRKGTGRKDERQWEEASFFDDLQSRTDSEEATVARKILDWSKRFFPEISWGKGGQDGSFIPVLPTTASISGPLSSYRLCETRSHCRSSSASWNGRSERSRHRERMIPNVEMRSRKYSRLKSWIRLWRGGTTN